MKVVIFALFVIGCKSLECDDSGSLCTGETTFRLCHQGVVIGEEYHCPAHHICEQGSDLGPCQYVSKRRLKKMKGHNRRWNRNSKTRRSQKEIMAEQNDLKFVLASDQKFLDCTQIGSFTGPACNRYYDCNKIYGRPILMICPESQMFDPESELCTYKKVHCTTPPIWD